MDTEPKSIAGISITQNNALKATHKKDKVAIYMFYWVVNESDFKKITNDNTSEEAWDFLEKAYRGDKWVK